ncbi:sterol desaturase family protein [Sphingomonas sp. MMSM20]|uniref:sterol desaturase family protein n=1 Tax=Sphingomonas lycopersici TaxID=2951807 RepID=UPI002237D1A3|nr:sterol desaturase family protein [Sphingomonas lycopersici]MCW6531266.1 sterol desaturase family protein [Sphingomonas lycopersici]
MSALDASSPRIRLFKNERLEKLTLISARVFAIAWGFLLPFIAWVGWKSAGPVEGIGLFAAGLLVWTLFEYAMHRYLFHLELEQSAAKWLVFLIHGNHHDNPNDPLRGIMPLSVSLPIAALIWATCVALIGQAGTWAFLGFITGYVAYDTIHYACHQWPMRGKLGAALKRHHMRHHYVDDTRNYAISAIFWDSAFCTRITSLRK